MPVFAAGEVSLDDLVIQGGLRKERRSADLSASPGAVQARILTIRDAARAELVNPWCRQRRKRRGLCRADVKI